MAGKKISELQALTTLTGEEELPVAIGGGNRKVTSSLLVNEIKTAQSSLLTRVNDYMYDMSGLLGKLAVRDGAGTDEKIDEVENRGFFRNDGVLEKRSAGFNYQILQVESNKVYYIKMPTLGIATVASLVLFDGDGNVLKTLPANKTIDSYFVFTGVDHIGLSWSDGIANSLKILKSFDIQDLTTILNTQQGNRALYVAAGAVYNQNTGFYELNGLTDITEEQMREIYVQTNPTKRVTDLCSVLNASSIRTNFPFLNRGGYKNIDCYAAFTNCTNLEVVAFGARDGDNFFPSRIIYAFINCIKLREIKSVLNVTSLESYNNKFLNTFSACRALEKILILNLKDNISFSDSPLLSLESLQYLITNAANTSPITVTVHADVYAKIQDEGQVDWHALIETAAAKQITFATA